MYFFVLAVCGGFGGWVLLLYLMALASLDIHTWLLSGGIVP